MLNGKIAIVTGGTRGIGLAVVRTFPHNGAKVALFGSREASVQRALAQLREEQREAETGSVASAASVLSVAAAA